MPVHGHACTHTGDDTCQLPDERPQAGWRDVADADLCLTPIFNATFPPPPTSAGVCPLITRFQLVSP